ncbi:uncharacterized protein BCR38DRAFT_201153 [Pseudomassariella vexata]|uniref:Uncharacterized protein n=1 Tax=Pseudomassariella vexata TaxID=1141098 RepID=A0A1Y2DX14_9PEZI|nr:uncharacterized protein BCR38DRAFT_201153 [Pseudomassariella vexata]ORY63842.1 hypothetical protein BCR38DRAFT_201153 [Pseudomassariella vexata]
MPSLWQCLEAIREAQHIIEDKARAAQNEADRVKYAAMEKAFTERTGMTVDQAIADFRPPYVQSMMGAQQYPPYNQYAQQGHSPMYQPYAQNHQSNPQRNAVAFDTLKRLASTTVDMHGHQFDLPVDLYSDASGYGAGCLITQTQEKELWNV